MFLLGSEEDIAFAIRVEEKRWQHST
jgi:hypothetical protein